ncbi:MAG: adenosyl-hopene transferase HpnH [Chloroflexi bacterium]|nr:adenosyl-hopene transferase HpnH [Chloroflexota bacterium]
MSVAIGQMLAVSLYIMKQKLLRRKRYPLVLMLEPLFRCNLTCAGCGKIQYPAQILKKHLSVEACLKALDECGVPVVSIAGGEPLMYPYIGELAEALVKRRKYVYLCTNAILLKEKLEQDVFKPSKYLSFSIHMDGIREDHDESVCKEGVYDEAVEAIKEALRRGFRVTTNTTLFDGFSPLRVREFFDEMTNLGVEGMMISPGYNYSKAPDQEHFLRRSKTHQLFSEILRNKRKSWNFNQSPLFLEFLMGERDYECTPWGNPTYNLFGWQRPCYLLQEGYAESFKDLMENTSWDNYGRKSGNKKCQDCMVHCGYEPTAVNDTFSSWRAFKDTVAATITGKLSDGRRNLFLAPLIGSEMSDEKTIQGWVPELGNGMALPRVIDMAFDYRGNITVVKTDGTEVMGYIFNRNNDVPQPYIQLFDEAGRGPFKVLYSAIKNIEFTGKDTAFGKSWEAWKKLREKEKMLRAVSGAQTSRNHPSEVEEGISL